MTEYPFSTSNIKYESYLSQQYQSQHPTQALYQFYSFLTLLEMAILIFSYEGGGPSLS